MSSRMDKYKNIDNIPKRSEKNQDLYKQIYNAYDEFENLVVPSNAREIDLSDLKREVSNRDEYRKLKDYGSITNNRVVKKKIIQEQREKENQIYDINELLDIAISSSEKNNTIEPTLSSGDYLKKLKLDNNRSNIEQIKEMYDEMANDDILEEDESLMKTANLSLEILSDLKSDNDNTLVSLPVEEDEEEFDNEKDDSEEDLDFYSNTYKFSKSDFDKENVKNKSKIADEDDDELEESDSARYFLKIFLLIFGIAITVIVVLYLISYFKRA